MCNINILILVIINIINNDNIININILMCINNVMCNV